MAASIKLTFSLGWEPKTFEALEKSLSEWSKLGFKKIDNSNLPENELNARLVAPDGLNGKMFIVYTNYKNILYYNCSHYYALTVGLLSDNIISYN